jgi:putative protease
MSKYLELVCPAGTPSALRAAVDAGADTVYCGFRDATNARNYPGLNFDPDELAEGVAYAHQRKCRVLVAVNTFPRAGDPGPWRRAIDNAAAAGADAVILADLGVLEYAATQHPKLRRHLSVQASAASPYAIRFYQETFSISRVVLPRVLSIDEVRALIGQIDIEAEVFAFGSLGTMVEGRCFISSYITGCSPSSDGACAPAAHVSYSEEDGCLVTRLDDVIMNRFEADEAGAYPTPCKGRFIVRGKPIYLFEEPVALNVIPLLAQLKAAGVTALKIEGRQRSRAYVGQVVAAFRKILDAAAAGQPMPAAVDELRAVAEGGRETFSAYAKGWR